MRKLKEALNDLIEVNLSFAETEFMKRVRTIPPQTAFRKIVNIMSLDGQEKDEFAQRLKSKGFNVNPLLAKEELKTGQKVRTGAGDEGTILKFYADRKMAVVRFAGGTDNIRVDELEPVEGKEESKLGISDITKTISNLTKMIEGKDDIEERAREGEDLHIPSERELDHEEMRIRTMSEKALHARLGRITDAQKMYSFAFALKDNGLDTLSEIAFELLNEMGWDRNGSWIGEKAKVGVEDVENTKGKWTAVVERIKDATDFWNGIAKFAEAIATAPMKDSDKHECMSRALRTRKVVELVKYAEFVNPY